MVNICSVSSYVDLPLSAVYCASKVALLSVTNCLRMEVQPLGVRVLGEPCRSLHLVSTEEKVYTEACMHAVGSRGTLAIGGQTQRDALPRLMLSGSLRSIWHPLRFLASAVYMADLRCGISACAAVTAGLIESEIRNNNKCDFDRYYGSTSAYHSIADAIQKRMDILAKFSLAGSDLIRMPETPDRHRHWLADQAVRACECCWGDLLPWRMKHRRAGSAWYLLEHSQAQRVPCAVQ